MHVPIKTKVGPSGTVRAEELCSCSHLNCQWLSTSKAEAHRHNICYHNHMPMDMIRKRMAEEYNKLPAKSPTDREAAEQELKQMAQELEEAMKCSDSTTAPKAQAKSKAKATAKAAGARAEAEAGDELEELEDQQQQQQQQPVFHKQHVGEAPKGRQQMRHWSSKMVTMRKQELPMLLSQMMKPVSS